MTSLPALLGTATAILQAHPLCKETAIIETKEFSPNQFFFKIRAELPQERQLQVRIYFNADHIDYAYQLFSLNAPLLRWDNKEEFRELKTYPHHCHDDKGNILPSPLSGNLQTDIPFVLQEIEKYLEENKN